MTSKNITDGKSVEARLDRSLRNQVQAPRLDRGFDASVWARIAREEPNTAKPAVVMPSRAARASRWFAIANALGITVTLGVALYFALGSLGGIEPQPLNVELNVSLPTLEAGTVDRAVAVLGQMLGVAALAFGLSFTSLGRRVRSRFS